MYERETKQLTQAGIRTSKQRLLILAYLNQLCETHPTIDEIYQALHETQADLSVATVYNTVNLFCERGMIIPVEYPGQVTRYDRRTDEHAHFLCRACGRLYDLPVPNRFEAAGGFLVEEAHLLLRGICPHCREQGQTPDSDTAADEMAASAT